MENSSVVFAVKNDIVERLKNLHKSVRMTFILGGIEKDYFGNHYVSIEELGDYWKSILEVINNREIVIDVNDREGLIFEDEYDMIILQKPEKAKQMNDIVERITHEELHDYFIHHYSCLENHFSDFQYYFDNMKIFLSEAVQHNASLLFCIDKI